jgi:hypothetical protein
MIARLGAVPLFFALRIASALLLLKLMASFLPVSGFALCAQLMAFGAVLNVVAVGAAQNGIIRQSAAAVDAAALARAQGAALALWLGIGPLLVAGVAANAGRLSAVILGNGDNGRAIVALAALAVAAGPGQIWCSVLSGRMHTVGSLGAQALGLLAGTATGAWFILHGRPISAGIGFACGPLVAMTVAALLMRRAGLALALPRLRPRDMRALLRYSASIAATTAVSATLLFGLRSVYRDAFGAAALGHWLAANRISDMSSQLVGLFMTQFFVPHLTAITDMAERRRFILRCGGAGAAVTAARRELAPRVAFHAWVQHRCEEQLTAVRDAARDAGMALGVLHDLPVGVDADGADAWALADVLATGVSIGAPPDNFTPRGQDWGLPPFRPDRLAATGYAALRDMLRAVLGHADGLRIDHVAGLWRLWWIPPGDGPDRGTYVHYDADVMLAVLALEAHRAGATVVGEDLGTVEPEVTKALADNEMLGCAVSWFTRDESAPGEPLLPPAKWPSRAAASLSTHDLPTAAGFLRGEHVHVRAELGLLDDVPGEQSVADKERAEWVELLRSEGLLSGPDPDEAAIITAMHRLLAATPSRLKLISPYDVLGEPRQPNLPGTVDEYPNWRLPLPETLEELRADPRVAEITAAFRAAP